MCDACNEQFAVETWGDGSSLTCEACGKPLTPEEIAANTDPQYYRNCASCATSQF